MAAKAARVYPKFTDLTGATIREGQAAMFYNARRRPEPVAVAIKYVHRANWPLVGVVRAGGSTTVNWVACDDLTIAKRTKAGN